MSDGSVSARWTRIAIINNELELCFRPLAC